MARDNVPEVQITKVHNGVKVFSTSQLHSCTIQRRNHRGNQDNRGYWGDRGDSVAPKFSYTLTQSQPIFWKHYSLRTEKSSILFDMEKKVQYI